MIRERIILTALGMTVPDGSALGTPAAFRL